MVVQVSDMKYAPTRAGTKAFLVEAWRFSGEAKMLVSQNHTTRNYGNSITYQVYLTKDGLDIYRYTIGKSYISTSSKR